MNEFKSRQIPTKEQIERAKEQEKQQRKIEHNLKLMRDAKIRKNKELILLCYQNGGKLTNLEKEAFFAIDETTIPEGTYRMLYCVAREYIEKGKIKTFEEYKEKYKKEMHNPDLLERNMPLGVNVNLSKDKEKTR
ncbi:MAG: hypothetical protein HFJ36_02360 [Clostridia bacterium]|nr:hypothetical protein [Clostridia bacterium]